MECLLNLSAPQDEHMLLAPLGGYQSIYFLKHQKKTISNTHHTKDTHVHTSKNVHTRQVGCQRLVHISIAIQTHNDVWVHTTAWTRYLLLCMMNAHVGEFGALQPFLNGSNRD